ALASSRPKPDVAPVMNQVRVSDASYARDLALAGIGVAYIYEPRVTDDLAAGRLGELRPEAAWRRDEIVAGCEKAAPVLAEAWRSFAEPEADIRPVLRGLRIPILFAWGLRDRIQPWFLVRGLARRTPGARIALFDAGHAAFLETPEAFDAAFLDFARSLPRPKT
ncbi:MAG: hypothetical protein ACK5SU_03180, partial [Phenylobacterium sp.]